jgi:hypothetical protein
VVAIPRGPYQRKEWKFGDGRGDFPQRVPLFQLLKIDQSGLSGGLSIGVPRTNRRKPDGHIWIARVLRDLEFKVHFPRPVVGDSQSALATASVPETKQLRHINLRGHWIRNVLHLGDLIIGFIPGKLNAVNIGMTYENISQSAVYS